LPGAATGTELDATAEIRAFIQGSQGRADYQRMGLGLLRRLFGPTEREPVSVVPREEARPRITAIVDRPVSAAPVPSNHKPPTEDAVAIETWLDDRLTAAIRELDAATRGTERTVSFLTMLGRVASSRGGRLRRPPAAAQRAMSACRRDDAPVDMLVELLENDPALSQAILARANSAYYSRGGPRCLGLRDAIIRQGRQSVNNVLVEQSMTALLFTGTESTRRMVDQVWSHMVRTAPLARDLSAAFGVDAEQAFALALLHDVGKLAVFDVIATLRTAERSELAISGQTLSRTLSLLHEPLGGQCALGWDLGNDAARAIASHHRTAADPPERLTEAVWLAERIDLATVRGQAIDLAGLWREGRLTGDRDMVERMLEASA
jgi:HD-like signal output (HDOD) protein